MNVLDYVVLISYFVMLLLIGYVCSRKINRQEDYFMGGRGFGKLLQTFAAFGAGTGSQDPIAIGRTTWTSGLSGIWSALNWLFITPFYWIFAVWYRRMRHLTLGDWFVERYESKAMGVAYTMFAFSFQILYLSVMFSAISKVVEPLLGADTILQIVSLIGSENPDDLRYVLVPATAIVVLGYGILGGLAAAYWTDLIQGLGIILLSVILIPTGLNALVTEYGANYPELVENERQLSTLDGFTIMHDRLSSDFFQLFNAPQAGEFSIQYIVALIGISLIGIVVQPHFIATGGGSARTENAARIGLVTGNFLKRLCTIGWGLTGLITLALLADNMTISEDPDRAWGIASSEILGPLGFGLVGLMLACLLAALMSSADTYMLVSSALLVRNVYAAYIDPDATERTYVAVGRMAGLLIIGGAAYVSVSSYDVLSQYVLALEVAASFAAPFWIGMYWRRATKAAAWVAMFFSVMVLVVLPVTIPLAFPDLRIDQGMALTTQFKTKQTTRSARLVDVERRTAERTLWEQNKEKYEAAFKNYREMANATLPAGVVQATDLPAGIDPSEIEKSLRKLTKAQAAFVKLGAKKSEIKLGDKFVDEFKSGGQSIFWSEGVVAVKFENDELVKGSAAFKPLGGESVSEDGRTTTTLKEYDREATMLKGEGRFNLEFLVYHWAGLDLTTMDKAWLKTLSLPPRILTPFLLMILLSFFTPRGTKNALDRYYVKMKTPVHPDPDRDRMNLEDNYADPDCYNDRKLFPGSNLEIQIPTLMDVLGFVACFGICFGFISILLWLASLGA